MEIDSITQNLTVMFVGDYFTLLTTVALEESLRQPDEPDDEFAVRLAAVWMGEHYGWDVLAASNEVGIVDENAGFTE